MRAIIGLAALAAMLALAAAQPARATERPLLHPMFGDHAVLQRNAPVNVWGWADPGAQVQVEVAGQSAEAVAGADGAWSVRLAPLAAGGPYTLKARSAGREQSVRDVMAGEVWLCSGQSNMEWTVKDSMDAWSEIRHSANDQIRLMHVRRNASPKPLAALPDAPVWAPASPETTPDFSAVCFYFGRAIQKKLGVPVGLVAASWGGSYAKNWTSAKGLRDIGFYVDRVDALETYNRDAAAGRRAWRKLYDAWWAKHEAAPGWRERRFDDSSWRTVRAPGFWEKAGEADLEGWDGAVFLRGAFTLTAQQARRSATLKLGRIEEQDTTWVNGTEVGQGDSPSVERAYPVSASTLRPGRNVIAVRVLDEWDDGGFAAAPDAFVLEMDNGERVPLAGEWRYLKGRHWWDVELAAAPHTPWIGQHAVTTLYNGMIAPLAPYTFAGVAWYQGESDGSNAAAYAKLLPNLFKDWRRTFGQELPFLVVQVSPGGELAFEPASKSWGGDIREVQRVAVAGDKRAYLAATIDIGDRFNVHPVNKQEVGRRLSLLARKHLYGETGLIAQGPTPVAATREGQTVLVRFDAPGGLKAFGHQRPVGFELCDADGSCVFADAVAAGETVRVNASAKPNATLVRYCYGDWPLCNVYGADNLPAMPAILPVR